MLVSDSYLFYDFLLLNLDPQIQSDIKQWTRLFSCPPRRRLRVNKNKQVLAKAGGCLEINVPNIRDGWRGDLELRFELGGVGGGWWGSD